MTAPQPGSFNGSDFIETRDSVGAQDERIIVLVLSTSRHWTKSLSSVYPQRAATRKANWVCDSRTSTISAGTSPSIPRAMIQFNISWSPES